MSETVYEDKVYVVRIKPTLKPKNWDEDDLVYAVAYEGNGELDFNGFKSICEKRNQMWFLTKKANVKNDQRCTWDQVIATMNNITAIGKQNLIHTSSALTFLELATLAYQAGIFTDSEGKSEINAMNDRQKTSSSYDRVTEPHDDGPTMIKKARMAAEQLAKNMKDMNTENFSQSQMILTQQYKSHQHDLAEMSTEDLVKIILDLEAKLASAEDSLSQLTEENAAKDRTIADHEAKHADLSAQITGAKNGPAGFMVTADMANLQNKILSDSLASEVTKGLKTFLSDKLKPLLTLNEKVDAINNNIVKAGNEVKIHADSLNAVLDTQHESTNEDIGEVTKALAGVGITAGGARINIPDTLAAIAAGNQSTNAQQQQQPAPKHPGECTYQASSAQGNTLICTLGCGSQIGVSVRPEKSSSVQVLNAGLSNQPPNLNASIQYASVPTGDRQGYGQNLSRQNNNGFKYNQGYGQNQQTNNNGYKSKQGYKRNWQNNYDNGGARIINKSGYNEGQQYLNVQYPHNTQYGGYQQQQVLLAHPVQGPNIGLVQQVPQGNVVIGQPQ